MVMEVDGKIKHNKFYLVKIQNYNVKGGNKLGYQFKIISCTKNCELSEHVQYALLLGVLESSLCLLKMSFLSNEYLEILLLYY